MIRKICKDSGFLILIQLMSLAIPLLTFPLLARRLGSHDLGKMVFILSVFQFVAVFIEYGFNLSGTKDIAQSKDCKNKITAIYFRVIYAKFVLAAFGAVVLLVYGLVKKEDTFLVVCATPILIGSIISTQWLLQGLNKIYLANITQVISKLVLCYLIYLLVKSPRDIDRAIFFQSSMSFFGYLICMPFVLQQLNLNSIVRPSLKEVIKSLRDGWSCFLSTAAISLYTVFNSIIIGGFLNYQSLAAYNLADKIVKVLQLSFSTVGTVSFPVASKLARSDINELKRFNYKTLMLMLIVSFAIILLGVSFGGFFIRYIFGDGYIKSSYILDVFLIQQPFLVISNVLGIQTLVVLGKDRVFSHILVLSAVLNLLLIVPALSIFGLDGAIWLPLCIEIVVVILMWISTKEIYVSSENQRGLNGGF